MEICDLGTLDGPVLLFGGPYSNVQALGALMDWANAEGIPASHRICTGDVVAYCADPLACIDMMRDLALPIVAGNCEKQLSRAAADCGCGFAAGSTCEGLSAGWYGYANGLLDDRARQWLGACPDRLLFRHHGMRHVVIHGGASDISRFLWPISPDDDFWHEISILQEEVGAFDAVVSGHSGVPFIRWIDGISWLNPGAIGMPANDGQSSTSFAVLEGGEIRFESLDYDVGAAVEAMRAAGLTQGYDVALSSGYWPSEDVLPRVMRHGLKQSDDTP